jgi:hypothetical protein
VYAAVPTTSTRAASRPAPDPDVPDTLKRTELGRRPLGFRFSDLACIDFALGLSTAV